MASQKVRSLPGADLTPDLASFFASLTNDEILCYAKLCKATKALDDGLNNRMIGTALQKQGLLDPADKVIVQAKRYMGQLGSIIVWND